MQKDFKDYTVGELLDMGFNVTVNNHQNPTKDQAYKILSQFEGLKQRSRELEKGTVVVKGWKGNFEFNNFAKEDTQNGYTAP